MSKTRKRMDTHDYYSMDKSRKRRLFIRLAQGIHKIRMSEESTHTLRLIERTSDGVSYTAGIEWLEEIFESMPRLLQFYYMATFDFEL